MKKLSEEHGSVLVIGLMFLGILSVLGTTAYMTSSTDVQISSNYKSVKQAFYAAEAGLEEARARFRTGATGAISDSDPISANWKLYIGTASLVAQKYGGDEDYDADARIDSMQSALSYAVKIEHQTSSGNVLYYNPSGSPQRNTTSGNNIYLVTSYGVSGGSNKTLKAEFTMADPIQVKAALYVEGPTDVNAKGTVVDGTDLCGSIATSLPGISTTLAASTVDIGTAKVNGYSVGVEGNTIPISPDVDTLINQYKGYANITHSGGTDSSVNWGVPVNLTSSPSCSVSNVVYVSGDIHLTSHSTGCGILLVDGDLNATGGIEWYGLIIVKGNLTNYTGHGGDDGIAGAAITGGSFKNKVSGSVELNYCSSAINNTTKNLPRKILMWQDF